MSEATQSNQLRALLGVAWRGKWVLMVAAAIAVGAAIFHTSRQPVVYTAEAQAIVEPVTFSMAATTATPINLETELKLALSEEVLAIASDQMDRPITIDELRRGLSVHVVPSTEIIGFSYRSQDPRLPADVAQSAAEAYLEFRRGQYVDELVAATDSIHERIQQEERRLEKLNRTLPTVTVTAEMKTIETQINAAIGRIAVLNQQLAQMPAPDAQQVGRIIQPANRSFPAPNPILRNVAMALVVGLALGMGIVVLKDHLDERPKDRTDLELHAGAAMLAAIPKVSGWKRDDSPLVALGGEQWSPAAEAYRTLRTGVLFAASERDLKTVMVTSAMQGEGKSATTANLAVALAQAGKRVVAISADLRRPRLHNFFGQRNSVGLSKVLSGHAAWPKAIMWTGVPNLAILPSGSEPGDPSHLLGSDRMATLADEIMRSEIFPGNQRPDFILIDAPPLLPVADAMAMAPMFDAVLIVADAENTSKSAIAQARMRLDQVNARVVGTVMNRFDPSKAGNYSGYYGQYGYKTKREKKRDAVHLDPYA